MTRWVCFQQDNLAWRIEQVSAKDGEMEGRNPRCAVRYHGRLGVTSHQRELLKERTLSAISCKPLFGRVSV